jgi:hypothetical protein
MPVRSSSPRWFLAALVGLLVIAPAARGDFDACVRHLRRTVNPQRDGSHLARLFALRQLRDPTVQPLLYKITQHREWQVQVHAILGLAELDERHLVDPWLVTQVNEQAQEAVIANAIDLELIGAPQMRELLGWDGLQPMSRVLLLAELMHGGETVDRETVTRLAGSANFRVSGLASLLQAQLGDTSAFSAYVDRLEALPKRERERHLLWLLEAVRQYETTAVTDWMRELARQPDVDPEVAYWAIYSVLLLDAEAGLPLWRRALGGSPSYRDQVRYGMLLLAGARHAPPDAFDELRPDNELLRRMIDAGRALASGSDPAASLCALVDLGHPKSATWVMTAVTELPDEQAARVYAHLIDSLESDQIGRAERISRAIVATTRLAEIDPAAVLERLRTADDDGVTQEVLLLGLFDSPSPEACAVAGELRRIGAGRADTLALLLIARREEGLGREDLGKLSRVVAGGGRVSDGLQVQAAWLYLKQTESIDRALTLVFDGDP